MSALIKRSRKNQVALPKTLLERAGVGPDDLYFTADYVEGAIVLRPVTIEEKISPEAVERFRASVVKGQPGDRSHSSMKTAIRALKKTR